MLAGNDLQEPDILLDSVTAVPDRGGPEVHYGNTEQRETEGTREGFPEEVPFNYLMFFFCLYILKCMCFL